MKRPSPSTRCLALSLLLALVTMGCPEAETSGTGGQPEDAGPERPGDLRRDPTSDPIEDPALEPVADTETDLPVDQAVDPVRDPGLDPLPDTTPDQPADPIPDPILDQATDTPADTGQDPPPEVAPDPQPDTTPACPNDDLGSALGSALATGTTEGQGDDNTSAICAVEGLGSPDVTLGWTAPRAGNFQFDTLGSDFDTVLYLLDGGCTGAEMNCNDDQSGTGSLQSSLVVPLSASQSVVIVIDGYGGDAGSYVLNIQERLGCAADADLGSGYGSPIAIGYISGNLDDSQGSCGVWEGGEDISFTWTAPTSARFRFTTEGSDFDTVLYLFGSDCATELDCNDDAWGDLGTQSLLEWDLVTGDQVVIVVDSYLASSTGVYQLNIYNISSPEVVCEDWADDDADGHIDCDDPTSCQGTPQCIPGSGPSGNACSVHSDCSAVGGDPSCFVEGMGWPGGYCAEYCDPDLPDCPDGSSCVLFVGDVGYCMDRCDGGYGSCRADTMPDYWNPSGGTISYVCDSFGIWTDGTLICGPSWWL